jgi:hypothetical protein
METMPEISEKVEKIGLLEPVFTLKTANSACSAAFYARISGIRENPLKYTDPDGKHDRLVNNISVLSSEDAIVGIGGGGYSGGLLGIDGLGVSVGIFAMAGIASKSISTSTVIDKTLTKNQSIASIRIQVQLNGSSITLATTGGISNSEAIGVTKSQAKAGLSTLKSKLSITNSGMSKSNEFNTAVDKMQIRIDAVKGVGDGQNVIQENFTYNKKRYRNDLDSYRGKGRNLSTP